MATSSFDTLKMAERLESAGVPPEQARMHAMLLFEVLAEGISSNEAGLSERFVSKQEFTSEISELKVAIARVDTKIDRLEARIDSLELNIDARIAKAIAELRSQMIHWIVSVGVLQTGLITALILKIVH